MSLTIQVDYREREYEFAGLQKFGRAGLIALAAAALCYTDSNPALAFRVSSSFSCSIVGQEFCFVRLHLRIVKIYYSSYVGALKEVELTSFV